jgi:hypothetical protein
MSAGRYIADTVMMRRATAPKRLANPSLVNMRTANNWLESNLAEDWQESSAAVLSASSGHERTSFAKI